jgi:hypothetical protein
MLEKERCYVTRPAWRAPVYEGAIPGFSSRERPMRSWSCQKEAVATMSHFSGNGSVYQKLAGTNVAQYRASAVRMAIRQFTLLMQ